MEANTRELERPAPAQAAMASLSSLSGYSGDLPNDFARRVILALEAHGFTVAPTTRGPNNERKTLRISWRGVWIGLMSAGLWGRKLPYACLYRFAKDDGLTTIAKAPLGFDKRAFAREHGCDPERLHVQTDYSGSYLWAQDEATTLHLMRDWARRIDALIGAVSGAGEPQIDRTGSSLRVASISLAGLFDGIAGTDPALQGRLTLPEYQRPYRWGAEQVAALADDLSRHFGEHTPHDYYLGSIILHRSADGCLNIIDGQQRITSIGILGLLAGVAPLPTLGYAAPESQQRIRANLAALRAQPLPLGWLTRDALAQISVTLVVTDSEDDAYRFFETQNSGGVRLSGIDIAKAHHLRAIDAQQQDAYARMWEDMGDLRPTVDAAMRGRFWQRLDWRDLASPERRPVDWRNQIVAELAQATGEDGHDLAYRRIVNEPGAPAPAAAGAPYDLRQPLDAGRNSIHYLKQFRDLLVRYCPKRLAAQDNDAQSWRTLYYRLVAESEASDYLRKLYDAALALYLSRFGDTGLPEAGLWLFRAVYSLRLSNDKMVKEQSVQRFVHDTSLLDWIAHSYTHRQLIARLRRLECKVSAENLENQKGKKRVHIAAVCQVLQFWPSGTELAPKFIAEHFDAALCQAIERHIGLSEQSK
jgi:hypothetical protein